MLSKEKFAEGMAILCEQFQREASELLLKGYWMVLSKLTDEDFERAIMNTLSTYKFSKLPLPADILAAVQTNPEDAAVLAVSQIEQAIRNHGAYSNVCFDDPIIHAVIQGSGGWIKLCEVSHDEWVWLKKDFIKHYKALSSLHPDHVPAVPPVLIGLHGGKDNEAQLNVIGKALDVVYVGDQNKALAWSSQKCVTQKYLQAQLEHRSSTA